MLPADNGGPYHSVVSGMWPLTGRAEELKVISGLTRHRDGPVGVVLAGAAGVGKTRLAREALALANPALDPKRLKIGQVLNLPSP